MYPFPFRIPTNRVVSVTQPFRSTELAAFYKSKGLNYPEHTAIDAIAGTPVETFGTPFVCPFPTAKLLNFTQADPVKGTSARIVVEYKDPSGNVFVLGCIHLSEAINKPTFHEGETMGYIGNFGYVLPEPTIGKPLDGGHAHITLIVNGTIVDPLMYLDPRKPFYGADTGAEKDVPAIIRAAERIREALRALGIKPVA